MRERSDPKGEVAAHAGNEITEKVEGFNVAVLSVARITMRMRMAVSSMRMRITVLRTRIRISALGLQTIKTRISIKSLLRKIIMEW